MPQVTVNLVPLKSDSEDKSNDGPDDKDDNDSQDQWSDHNVPLSAEIHYLLKL